MRAVIPAKAGIQMLGNKWIPACAGMTTVGGSFKLVPPRGGGTSLGLVADAKLG